MPATSRPLPADRPSRRLSPWGPADLKRRCQQLREQLAAAAADVVSPAELAAYWPGGPENSVEGRGAWIYCYANYARLADRLRPGANAATADAAEAALEAALADRPEPVLLTSGETVAVHPLSYEALEFCAALDRLVLRATELAGEYLPQESDASERLVALQPLVRAQLVRTWAWVITHGAALPFDVSIDWPDPPEWTRTMEPRDVLALALAHRRVNSQRNVLLSQLAPDDHRTTHRLSLGSFVGAYAHEHGGDAAVYMRRFALGKLFAQAISAARSLAAQRPATEPAPGHLEG